jgi:hypothetical protein
MVRSLPPGSLTPGDRLCRFNASPGRGLRKPDDEPRLAARLGRYSIDWSSHQYDRENRRAPTSYETVQYCESKVEIFRIGGCGGAKRWLLIPKPAGYTAFVESGAARADQGTVKEIG